MGSKQFWDSQDMEPKRDYKFVLHLNSVASWIVKSVKRPSYTVKETPHKYLHHTFYYPAGVEWDPVEITLVDPISHNAAELMMDIVNQSGYTWAVTNPAGQSSESAATISKSASARALGIPEIVQVNSQGDPVDIWTLQNAWISSVDFSELSYDSDSLSELRLTLRYDYATFESKTVVNILP